MIRLLLPGLCAGLLPACVSPAPQPSRSGPLLAGPARTPAYTGRRYAPYVQRPQPLDVSPGLPQSPYSPMVAYAGPWSPAPAAEPARPLASGGVEAAGVPPGRGAEEVVSNKPTPTLLVSVDERAAPVRPSEPAPPQTLPASIIDEPALVAALRCYLENRPGDAPKELSKVDDSTRDVLLTLLPLTVRVGENGLAQADPLELARIVDRLQALLWQLRPKAALVMDKFCFCRQISRFGVFEALAARPAFQPGEMIEVYAEIRNVVSQPYRSKNGDYRTHLRSTLDIRRPTGEVVWAPQRFDKPDDTMTPQHDYFQHYRLHMPNLEAGPYVLHVEVIDVPTGRSVRQKLEFTIGSSGGAARAE